MINTTPLSFSLDVSPVEFAKLMYENTDSNGKLNLHGWYDVEKDDTVTKNGYQCIIKWTKEDVEKIVEEYKLLHKELRTISKNLDKCDEACLTQINPYIESTNGILDGKHLEAAYFIYVAPFKSAEEIPLRNQVIGRVGEDLCGFEMIRHARRLCKLMQLKAPEKVIYKEGRMLIASMAINSCGTEITKQIIYGDDFMKIGNYDFTYIETISPIVKNGIIKYPAPHVRYKNIKNLPLNEYGLKEFCKFKLQNAKEVCGVYAWVINDEVVYIGEAANFKKRFNSGYGNISPKNCFADGQITNCKMNNVVYETYKDGQQIDIYFFETKDYKAIEKELLISIDTRYNVKNNKR